MMLITTLQLLQTRKPAKGLALNHVDMLTYLIPTRSPCINRVVRDDASIFRTGDTSRMPVRSFLDKEYMQNYSRICSDEDIPSEVAQRRN